MGMTAEPATPGEALRLRRLAAGLTQRELARRAGISIRALRDLEQGRSSSPQARSIHGLAAALELGAADRERLLASRRTRPGQGARLLDIAILGPLSVRLGDRPVQLRAPLQRALLGLLALHPDQAIGGAEVIDVLWGEDPPPTCQALLYSHVARLRRLLEPDRPARAPAQAVVRGGGGYRLRLERPGDQLDLARFDQLVTEAEQARAADDPGLACDLLAAALGCWRGPVLVDADPSGRLRRHPAAVAASQRRLAAAVALADLTADLGRRSHGRSRCMRGWPPG
jgi:transcriptional regulator with XRE-family HTH domain